VKRSAQRQSFIRWPCKTILAATLAESLGGTLVGTRQLQKPSGVVLDEVVYRISI
jgi:hypothetical protein